MALGRELIIGAATAPDNYAAICVTEARSLTINNEMVDITKPSCAAPGGKLESAVQYGIQKLSYSGAGAYVNSAAQKQVVADAIAQAVKEYELVVPTVGTFVGDGLLSSVELSGDKSGELQSNFSLELSGAITFTPAS